MNEKIKELAEQAGFDLDVHGSNDGNFYGWEGRWINNDIQKFAELIVKECAEIALLEDHDPSDCILSYFGLTR